MRALLKRLEEATYARDAAVRQQAQRFAADLIKFLDEDEDTLEGRLRERDDGGYEVNATKFTKALARPLDVVLLPKERGVTAQVERYDDGDALVLFCMYQPGDLWDVAARIDRNTVVHELIHLLDPGWVAPTNVNDWAQRMPDDQEYFNSAGEWNAYWQEGAAKLERTLHHLNTQLPPEKAAKARAAFIGDGTLKALQKSAPKFWDNRFLKALTPQTQRKFDKRLAALWDAMRP